MNPVRNKLSRHIARRAVEAFVICEGYEYGIDRLS